MYRNLGLDLAGCAKLLHVTERTLHNWQSGKHDIPFAAYKLLRLLNRMELPGEAWAGWSFHGDHLISPEGHTFEGHDALWTTIIRRSQLFPKLYRQVHGVAGAARTAGPGKRAQHGPAGGEAPRPTAVAGGRREAPALDLSRKHFGTGKYEIAANAEQFAINKVAYRFVIREVAHG